MTVRREPDSKDFRAWLRRAGDDLDSGTHLLGTMHPCPYWVVAYHAQQAAEKGMKAFLIWRGLPYSTTHDLRILLDQCAAGGAAWAEQHTDVISIGPLTVLVRYPSANRDVSREEAQMALGAAQRLLETIRSTTGPS